MGPDHASVANDFAYHPATDLTAERHDATRKSFSDLAHWVLDNVPSGPARSTAISRLREAMMWANAAIACDSTQSLADEQTTK